MVRLAVILLAAAAIAVLLGCQNHTASSGPPVDERMTSETSIAQPSLGNTPSSTADPQPTPTMFGGPHTGPMAKSIPQPAPTIFGGPHTTETVHTLPEPEFYGAATPPLVQRIYDSEVIARVTLLSEESNGFRFRVLEYLKGAGPGEIFVAADTERRREDWDVLEGLLFLNPRETVPAAAASQDSGDPPAQTFVFTSSHYEHPREYEIESLNPVWLPASGLTQAATEPGTMLASGQSGTLPKAAEVKELPAETRFITEWNHATGSPAEPMSLEELRNAVAWVEGEPGTPGYENCVLSVLNYLNYYRDWEAHHGEPWTPGESDAEVVSGSAAGTTVVDYGTTYDLQYQQTWLTGQHAELFREAPVDDDADPSNGYVPTITYLRPLPSGLYTFSSHTVRPRFIPCDFDPVNNQLGFNITAVAPDGVVHEAFFDPAAIGSAVGADGSIGALHPAAFAVGGSTASLESLKWQDGSATLTLDPYVSLSGLELDIIALDGSVALTLSADSAATGGFNPQPCANSFVSRPRSWRSSSPRPKAWTVTGCPNVRALSGNLPPNCAPCSAPSPAKSLMPAWKR